jgi:hypothetical protein
MQTITACITLNVDSNDCIAGELNLNLSPNKTFAQAKTEFATDLRFLPQGPSLSFLLQILTAAGFVKQISRAGMNSSFSKAFSCTFCMTRASVGHSKKSQMNRG